MPYSRESSRSRDRTLVSYVSCICEQVGGSNSKDSACNEETGAQSLDWEDHLEKETATHSSIFAWTIHGQRSLVCYSPWDLKE